MSEELALVLMSFIVSASFFVVVAALTGAAARLLGRDVQEWLSGYVPGVPLTPEGTTARRLVAIGFVATAGTLEVIFAYEIWAGHYPVLPTLVGVVQLVAAALWVRRLLGRPRIR